MSCAQISTVLRVLEVYIHVHTSVDNQETKANDAEGGQIVANETDENQKDDATEGIVQEPKVLNQLHGNHTQPTLVTTQ